MWKANNWSKELRDAYMKPARNTSTQAGTHTKPTCSSSYKGETSPQEIQFPIPRLQPHWLNADWRLFNHLQENVCAYLRAEKIKIRFWSGSLIMEILRRNTELITCHLHLQRKLQVFIHLMQREQFWEFINCHVSKLIHFSTGGGTFFKR